MCPETAVDGCAGDTLEVELALLTRKFQVFNEFFPFSETKINLPVDCAKKFHMHDSLVHMHTLKI